ncbi:urate hydroxylase PuuD [Paraherbaspirillum soli]|uniref:Urate hydroxylase PuuD n=1 Tax=Paraherbaspirillum soli TaxID=631222 RepID=A0ABW0MCK8_9BURK
MLKDFLWEILTYGMRWLHVVAAIAWMGFAFHTRELERKTKPRDAMPEGAVGEAWSIHGFGFYRTVKYLVPPKNMPAYLIWYKWQAKTTWITGFAMMALVYYRGAELYLIDPAVFALPAWAAIALSIAGLGLSWLIYDGLFRTPLANSETAIVTAAFLLLVVLAYLYSQLFSSRGAMMQMGATMATLVIANIVVVILPTLRNMVAGLSSGLPPPAELIARGMQRGRQNNYMVLTIVFMMISNHFPSAFAPRYAWVLIAAVIVIGGVIRYFFDTMHETGIKLRWPWGVSALLTLLLVSFGAFAPGSDTRLARRMDDPARRGSGDFTPVKSVIAARCSMCHASAPVWPGIASPPKGIKLETPQEIRIHAAQINRVAVLSHAMPPGNVTGLTDGERATLARWIAADAEAGEAVKP